MNEEVITLAHGSGGRKMQELISGLIIRHLSNPVLDKMEDAGVIVSKEGKTAVTTDSFVVSPLFFSGGDIGRLSVCGTINDLAAMGAVPKCITTGFIIEEGLPVGSLKRILVSIRKACDEAGVFTAAGDTKVVEKGKADGIFINTSGIGEIKKGAPALSCSNARPGDAVILSGTLGDHEIAILKERKGLSFKSAIKSDCAPLNKMILPLMKPSFAMHAMRDPTRGGLAAVLNEIAAASGVNIAIDESRIRLRAAVRAACGVFGFDPLYLANEGKMAIICAADRAAAAVKVLRRHRYGKNAAIIGRVAGNSGSPKVYLRTKNSGERIVFMPEGEQLPRIC